MWRRFRESRAGSIGPAAAVIMPVLALSAAITLETADQSRIKGMMQASLDGALLAVSAKAKSYNGMLPVYYMMPELKEAFVRDYSANFSQVMYGNSDFTLNEEDLKLSYDSATKTASAEVFFPIRPLSRAFSTSPASTSRSKATRSSIPRSATMSSIS